MKLSQRIVLNLLVICCGMFKPIYGISEEFTAVSESFKKAIGLQIESIERAEIPGLVQVVTESGIFYVSEDGTLLLNGTMHQLTPGLKNLTAARIAKDGARLIKALKPDFITFTAEPQRHEILVFYDSTCGYCRKLHQEISAYQSNGITVHYAAYPRTGVNKVESPTEFTSSYQQLNNIWCADDPHEALTLDAGRGFRSDNQCSDYASLKAHY